MTRRSPLRLLWAGIWQMAGEWGTGRKNAMVKEIAFTMAFKTVFHVKQKLSFPAQ